MLNPPGSTRTEVTREVTGRLGSADEARWLIEEILGRPEAHRRRGDLVSSAERATIDHKVERRLSGEPLQYVLGRWSFRTLDLAVDPRVLIPRPETEQVVEVALDALVELAADRPRVNAVDLGTGSGAIALSLAAEFEGPLHSLSVWATDRDPAALEVAAANRQLVGIEHPAAAERVALRQGDWFEALPPDLAGQVSLLVSNPPYVWADEWDDLEPEVRAEPRGALVAGDGPEGTAGVADVLTVLAGAPRWLARPGAVVIEIAPHQATAASAAARRAGFGDVALRRDLSGRERAVIGWLR